jgi:hypothetical protein
MREKIPQMAASKICFFIRLTKTEQRMLRDIGRGDIFKRKCNSAEAARTLLCYTLAHFDIFDSLMTADTRYAKREGFETTGHCLMGLIRHQHAKISGRKVASKKSN